MLYLGWVKTIIDHRIQIKKRVWETNIIGLDGGERETQYAVLDISAGVRVF